MDAAVISIPMTEAKARISGLIERLINLKEPIMITKHGKPVATLIPYEEWEKIEVSKAVNVAEIFYGLFRLEGESDAGAPHALLEFLMPFETEDAQAFGRLKAALERKGRPRFEPDLQIAAIALRYRLTVVTGNVRHFEGIAGLRIENWLA
jgi:tRNA(fMet)-specific endonuclease VapC